MTKQGQRLPLTAKQKELLELIERSYRSASLEYCWGTEQFQGPTASTAFGTITNANAGQPIPITIDPKNCQPRLEDVLIQAMRKPLQPWPVPFLVIQQQ